MRRAVCCSRSLTTEDYAALRSLLETHLASHPDNVNTLYSLGAMYLRENELQKAKDSFLRLEGLVPGHAQVHYNLGLIYLREGKEQEGQASMARFRELKAKEDKDWLKHNRAHARRLDAKTALTQEEPRRAIEIYSDLVEEGTAPIPDLIALAHVYRRVGDNESAYSWFDRALKASPYEKDALEGLSQMAEAIGRDELAAECRERLKLLADRCAEQEG